MSDDKRDTASLELAVDTLEYLETRTSNNARLWDAATSMVGINAVRLVRTLQEDNKRLRDLATPVWTGDAVLQGLCATWEGRISGASIHASRAAINEITNCLAELEQAMAKIGLPVKP